MLPHCYEYMSIKLLSRHCTSKNAKLIFDVDISYGNSKLAKKSYNLFNETSKTIPNLSKSCNLQVGIEL